MTSKTTSLLIAIAAAATLAACDNNKVKDAQADAVRDTTDAAASNMENKADAMEKSGEATGENMRDKADAMRDNAENKADAIEAGKIGATTKTDTTTTTTAPEPR